MHMINLADLKKGDCYKVINIKLGKLAAFSACYSTKENNVPFEILLRGLGTVQELTASSSTLLHVFVLCHFFFRTLGTDSC